MLKEQDVFMQIRQKKNQHKLEKAKHLIVKNV